MAKWLRREHSDAEKYNGLRFFLTENSYNSQKWLTLMTNFLSLLGMEGCVFEKYSEVK